MTSFAYDGDILTPNNLEITSFATLKSKIRERRVCVFLGAGFSKAWDDKYPLSNEVFSISEDEALENIDEYGFFSLFDSLKFKWADANAGLDDKANVFKSFKYALDVYKRYPSLLPSYLDRHTLELFEAQVKLYVKNKFAKKIPANDLKLSQTAKFGQNKRNIISFFKSLQEASALDVVTTNYDIVIDKVLHHAFPERSVNRGFPVHHNNILVCPQPKGIGLYKLNGGFEVVAARDGFKIDYDSLLNAKVVPNIILPSNEQDYGDKYFKTAFVKSSTQLRQADLLIFIGYSFPKEDFIINFLLKTFLDGDSTEKETVIIGRNKSSAIEIHQRACEVFKELNDKSALYYFGGSFSDLCKQC
ncbi:TPA: SIR2 family protein [Escherichia coli]|uniref:SIR2 family protein n=2 Tax=Enterobacterales TaxID=91347 RepID=UPI000301399A|nr:MULTISPECIES: SIR2 family protein [Enterobacteriaceae]ELP2957013.1 SIR2 family protein [Escherichia coli O168]EEQ1659408.1 hypothetical protein [Escherichia coli]EEX1756086.1 hypothetical protein [Escherichia coli]EEX5906902.1 hypothetical protein [Escherichia coli]EEZ4413430.1 hypothetical protein [Escherichia coli]